MGKKYKADITIMIAIFCMAFLAFCAFGVDMAYVTINRTKFQRAVETTTLATLARYQDDKNKGTANDIAYKKYAKDIFNMYMETLGYTGRAKITTFGKKSVNSNKNRMFISAELLCPTYFLRFIGVGTIRVQATSYAQSSKQSVTKTFTESPQRIDLDEVMTDKIGNELHITTEDVKYGYFVLAGRKNTMGDIVWEDLGCKANVTGVSRQVGNKDFLLICSDDVKFDLGKSCTDTNINMVEYIRVFSGTFGDCIPKPTVMRDVTTSVENNVAGKRPSIDATWRASFPAITSAESIPPMPAIPSFPVDLSTILGYFPHSNEGKYTVKVLNNVKLITRTKYQN